MRSKEQRTSQCRHCGKPCYNRGYQVVHCSNACKLETDKKKSVIVTEPCVVCGTSVTKRRYLANPVKATCCSNACQKQWSIVANRGPGNTGCVDWTARSKKAKDRYHKKASRERFEKSEYKKWLQVAKSEFCRMNRLKSERWLSRCTSAAQCLKTRLEPKIKKQELSQLMRWDVAFRKENKRLKAKSKRGDADLWKIKTTSVVRGLHHRRLRRQGKMNT